METIKESLKKAACRLKNCFNRLVDRVGDIAHTREKRQVLYRYAGLALLLAVLGLGSYAWRTREQSGNAVPPTPPRAAAAMLVPTLEPASTPEPEYWAWPLEGECLADYSPEVPVWSETLGQWQTHPGLDIAGSPGEAVYACRDGVVSEVWNDRLWGNVVVIRHEDGYESTYAGLNTLELVDEGDAVKAGQVIGSVGQSAACEAERGWHLHFELTKDGEPVDFRALMP